jgi:hypothetical protein
MDRLRSNHIERRFDMYKIGRSVIAALVLGALVAGVYGCKKKEGPMERTGKEMDKAAEKAGQQIEKAIEKTGEKIEKAGEKIKDAAKDLKK